MAGGNRKVLLDYMQFGGGDGAVCYNCPLKFAGIVKQQNVPWKRKLAM